MKHSVLLYCLQSHVAQQHKQSSDAFSLQWLGELARMLCYRYTANLIGFPSRSWDRKFFLSLHSTGSERPNRTVLQTKGNWFALVFHPVQQLCVIKLNFCHYVTSLVIVTDTLDALTAPLFLPDSFESDVIDPPRILPSVQTIALILILSRSFVWHNLYFRFQKLFSL